MSGGDPEKHRLLVVEDEPDILCSIKLLLEARCPVSVKVLTAQNVQEAQNIIGAGAGAVLTDWNLPDGTGEEVITAAREAGIPVGAMTAGSDNEARARALGVEVFLSKPFSAERLRVAVAQLLGQNPQP